MKLFSKSKKQTPTEEKEMENSASTVDISDPAAAPIEGLPASPDQKRSIRSKDDKKKLKEAEKEAKAEAKAAKKDAKKAEKEAKQETKVAKKKLGRRHTMAADDNKKSGKFKGDVVAALNYDELMKEMDPNKVMKVLKQFAEEDSNDLVGQECLKAMQRAENSKSPRKSPSSDPKRRSRQTREGKPPSTSTAAASSTEKKSKGGFRRSKTTSDISDSSKQRMKDRMAQMAKVAEA